MTSEISIAEIYDAHARSCDPKDFQAQVMRNPHGRSVGDDQIAMIIQAISTGLDIRLNDALLDLCCGNGAISDPIFARCQGGVGVDLAPYLIEVAVENFQKAPGRVYRLSDVEEYVATSEDASRFTKVLFYGAFQNLSEQKARNVLTPLRHRFDNIGRIFIGNLPDLDRAAEFFREFRPDCPPLEHLKRHDTLGGIWRTEREVEQLMAECGWRCEITRMPPGYYAAHCRFDATLTPEA
jgi:SAM-dependent methyltransferase